MATKKTQGKNTGATKKPFTAQKSKAANPAGLDQDSNGAFDPAPPSFVVRGQVLFADGTPLAGARVRAYDKDLCSEEPLGEPPITLTDKGGQYEIAYTAGQFARAEKRSADLIVRVVNPRGGESTASSILYNARSEETVDLVVNGEYSRPSEYERLITELAPVVHMPLYQLNDIKGGLEDAIDFLAGDTGQDRQHIAWLAHAATLAHESFSQTAQHRVFLQRYFMAGSARVCRPTGRHCRYSR